MLVTSSNKRQDLLVNGGDGRAFLPYATLRIRILLTEGGTLPRMPGVNGSIEIFGMSLDRLRGIDDEHVG